MSNNILKTPNLFLSLPSTSVIPKRGVNGSVGVFSLNGDFSWAPFNDLSRGPEIFARTFTGRLTANRQYTWPDKNGTVAMTNDIPTLNVLALSSLQI